MSEKLDGLLNLAVQPDGNHDGCGRSAELQSDVAHAGSQLLRKHKKDKSARGFSEKQSTNTTLCTIDKYTN